VALIALLASFLVCVCTKMPPTESDASPPLLFLGLSSQSRTRNNRDALVSPRHGAVLDVFPPCEDVPLRPTKKGILGMGTMMVKCMFASQLLMMLTLMCIIVGVVFASYRLSTTVTVYMEAASPYIETARDHTMNLLRNADTSSTSMSAIMQDAENHTASMLRNADTSASSLSFIMQNAVNMTTTSIPSLMQSVNHTAGMIRRMSEIAKNPTVKVSLS